MNRLLFWPLTFSMTIISLNAYAENQQTASEVRTVAPFHEVSFEGNTLAKITTTGNPLINSITIAADAADLPNVITEVDDHTLLIKVKNKHWWKDLLNIFSKENKPRVVAEISVGQLTEVTASGTSTININDQHPADKIELDFSGTSDGTYNGVANTIELETSGTSLYNLVGSAQKLKMETSGSAKIDAEKLTAHKAKIEASGEAEIKVNVTEQLDVDASGNSTIEVSGAPAQVNQHISGNSKVVMKK